MAAVTVHDETATGQCTRTFSLAFLTAQITVAELISKRVCEEVDEYNRNAGELFQGLVQPLGAERTARGYRMTAPRPIDAEAQALRALEAFTRNGFIVIVDDRQVERLDEEIELRSGTEISFLKLVPLVGG
ncbi:MAG TPA: hypothetical protein VKV26_14430 [Dehalococcoidia bacterium]|nr:hypothetical protein [Dehalococcoidia bacterium]